MKRAYAKINIGLDIIEKRKDGYHNIDTIFHKIDLYDEIEFQKSDETIIIYEEGDLIADDLMLKAQSLLEDHTGRRLPFKAKIKKNIPIGAGLAGGSSDSAEVILFLNKAYDLKLSKKELIEIGKRAGADVPFFISRYISARGLGIGDRLSPLDLKLDYNLLLIKPDFQISTKEVYSNINEEEYGKINLDRIEMQLKMGEAPKDLNIMEGYVFFKHPILKDIKEELYKIGAKIAFMSGSGSTMVGMFKGEIDLEKIIDIKLFKDCKIIKAHLL